MRGTHEGVLEGDVGVTPEHRTGRVAQRPRPPSRAAEVFTDAARPLGVVHRRDTLVWASPGLPRDRSVPLLVILHGAGGDAKSAMRLARSAAPKMDAVVMAPASRDRTWDFIVGRIGPDVAVIDRSLDAIFDQWAIDPRRIVIAGFSDGASYALTLGLANGGLFPWIVALSPGFMAPPVLEGKPRVFVTHGTSDRVLPIGPCSRTLVPSLREEGYEVEYVEFDDGHVVPPGIARQALARAGIGPALPA